MLVVAADAVHGVVEEWEQQGELVQQQEEVGLDDFKGFLLFGFAGQGAMVNFNQRGHFGKIGDQTSAQPFQPRKTFLSSSQKNGDLHSLQHIHIDLVIV